MTSAPTIVWFRQDLRLSDNRSLAAAVENGRAIVPVYVLDDAGALPWRMGGASRWWLDGSLAALAERLEAIGSRLILRRGPSVEALMGLAAETGARSINVTRAYEPAAAALETKVKTAGDAAGIDLRRFSGALLHEPETVRTKSGGAFQVFTPFWRSCCDGAPPRRPLPSPSRLRAPEHWPESDQREDWRLRPRSPDWAAGLRDSWQPGETGAEKRLAVLIDRALQAYGTNRDRPDVAGTSMLSPHLHFGEISPAQCWQAVTLARDVGSDRAQGAAAFLREIGWREFSYHLMHHWPHITDRPFRGVFANFPWASDVQVAPNLRAWQMGQTGYPIVDAGMRQLWQTGWMHNRVRMIAASFLTKHLLQPWQTGAAWFWDTLVDADLASNSASWQWVAGSGADAAPYFRIFNPILQGQKFDPEGTYVRSFVPELAQLPAAHIHAPWLALAATLNHAGVKLGVSYPLPIVEHAAARARALAAYAALKAER